MKPHLLIAIDAFGDTHIEAIAQAVEGWATWERIPETASPAEQLAKLATADIMIGWPEPEWLLPSPIKLLLCPSVGYDEYQVPELITRLGFTFCNGSGIKSEGVAEHCLAMMMALTRRLPQYIRAMQSHRWQQRTRHEELAGATACIVGLGGIGLAVARRCAALGMQVIGVRRHSDRVSDPVQRVYAPQQLREAVAAADHVIATLPGGAATANMFDRDVFEAMKPGGYFYNVGRGDTVDENELVRRLQNGHLAGAGLDVFVEEPLPADSPLWTMENVIVTPHMAGYDADHADRICDLMTTNLRRYRENQPLLNEIDLGRIDP
ncbi:MAG: D-2-hydroxyacid dehydrogenase [Truepera sp.]|nr:D-2-hydroxyacid dehydrogenase [Truepera sp.]